jgi:hypothetical protein
VALYSISSLEKPAQDRVLECIYDALDSSDVVISTNAVEGVSKCILLEKIEGNEVKDILYFYRIRYYFPLFYYIFIHHLQVYKKFDNVLVISSTYSPKVKPKINNIFSRYKKEVFHIILPL